MRHPQNKLRRKKGVVMDNRYRTDRTKEKYDVSFDLDSEKNFNAFCDLLVEHIKRLNKERFDFSKYTNGRTKPT